MFENPFYPSLQTKILVCIYYTLAQQILMLPHWQKHKKPWALVWQPRPSSVCMSSLSLVSFPWSPGTHHCMFFAVTCAAAQGPGRFPLPWHLSSVVHSFPGEPLPAGSLYQRPTLLVGIPSSYLWANHWAQILGRSRGILDHGALGGETGARASRPRSAAHLCSYLT